MMINTSYPKVLILLSTYNGSKYLKAQIDSLLKQEKVDVNILIRDDESTDNTVELLNNYANKYENIKWYSNKHKNVTLSFLELVNMADDYSYYAFCDQDDYWEPNKISSAINLLSKYDDIPAVYYSSLNLVDSDLNYLSTHVVSIKRSDKAKLIFAGAAGCTMVFNNELIKYLKGIYPKRSDIIIHDSWTLKTCILIGGKVIVDQNSYIKYRQHDNNVMGLSNKFRKRAIRFYQLLFNYSLGNQLDLLLECHNGKITTEYIEFIDLIIGYKKSTKKWFKLLFYRKIGFDNMKMNLLYRLKVLFRNL